MLSTNCYFSANYRGSLDILALFQESNIVWDNLVESLEGKIERKKETSDKNRLKDDPYHAIVVEGEIFFPL